jgi:uncharacterized protein
MSLPVNESLNSSRLAEQAAVVTGSIAIAAMPRLEQLSAEPKGEASYTLSFHENGAERPAVDGAIEATLVLICQRCMESFEQPLSAQVHVELLNDPEEQVRDADYEPFAPEGKLTIAELVENELLLLVPIAPVHPYGVCGIAEQFEAKPEDSRRPSPFAALKDLNLK